jgi:hypothetical protein
MSGITKQLADQKETLMHSRVSELVCLQPKDEAESVLDWKKSFANG